MIRLRFVGHKGVSKGDPNREDGWLNFTCGHCGQTAAAAVVALAQARIIAAGNNDRIVRWLLCPGCGLGSVANPDERQEYVVEPPPLFGGPVNGLPKEVGDAYTEARKCISVGAFNACELICRKILMHVAVEKGDVAGNSFAQYISYLEGQGFVTPPMKPWVDQIRKIGNAAAHQLDLPDRKRSESTLAFTAALLRMVYEMDHLTKAFVIPPHP